MTPARRHREHHEQLVADPIPVVSVREGGHSPSDAPARSPSRLPPGGSLREAGRGSGPVPPTRKGTDARTPASAHRDRTAAARLARAATASAPAAFPPAAAGAAPPVSAPHDPATAQVALRLTHDLRRLKEIKAVHLKVAAKRQMLPEYRDWVAGLMAADAGLGTGVAAEVAPTVMVWMIDTGDFAGALDLADFLMRHRANMPARYNRDLPTVLVEEIAEAALKAQAVGDAFPMAVLERVEAMTDGLDMHDEVRAKLMKALGTAGLRDLEDGEAAPGRHAALVATLATLRFAQALHGRIGVKDRIRRTEKLLAAHEAAFPPPPPQGEAPAQGIAG